MEEPPFLPRKGRSLAERTTTIDPFLPLAMRLSLLAAALLLLCTGCQQGFHPHVGRSVAFEHWFPVVHTQAAHGVNTHSRPPCPYFDPPPSDGAYAFCEECGVYHAMK